MVTKQVLWILSRFVTFENQDELIPLIINSFGDVPSAKGLFLTPT